MNASQDVQLLRWAEKAYKVLHTPYKSGRNYGIPESWLAGLVYVECSRLDPKANRFEPHVYRAILNAKKGIFSTSFPGFSSGELGEYIRATDDTADLKALATSFGLGQIMGYHYYNKWGLLPQQFRNLSVEESVHYTLKMMGEGTKWAKTYPKLLRWWNTGSIYGKTHNAGYVGLAESVARHYKTYASGVIVP